MKKDKSKNLGKWRITEMEMWDREFVDMFKPGYFSFKKDNLGYFQFGLVEGQIDYRVEKIGDIERLEFSWEGRDENDEALGRGWAVIKDDQLEGRLYFHLCDDYWFKSETFK